MDGVPLLLPLPFAVRCNRCTADLSTLAPAARFCPKCGLNLADAGRSPARPSQPSRESMPSTFTPLPAADRPSMSCIVRGYANAMFKLGVRYEVRHNDHEAVRCYGKASRLGNEPAAARLARVAAGAPLRYESAAPQPGR